MQFKLVAMYRCFLTILSALIFVACNIPEDSRLFLAVGEKEGDMVDASQKMYDYILQTGHPKKNVALLIDPDGDHSEASWENNSPQL